LGAYRIKLLTLELLEEIMGLETVVLTKLKEVDPQLQACFYNGTLFIDNEPNLDTLTIYRINNAIKSVVTCPIQISKNRDEIAIDFI
jgi:hypothetical protein